MNKYQKEKKEKLEVMQLLRKPKERRRQFYWIKNVKKSLKQKLRYLTKTKSTTLYFHVALKPPKDFCTLLHLTHLKTHVQAKAKVEEAMKAVIEAERRAAKEAAENLKKVDIVQVQETMVRSLTTKLVNSVGQPKGTAPDETFVSKSPGDNSSSLYASI